MAGRRARVIGPTQQIAIAEVASNGQRSFACLSNEMAHQHSIVRHSAAIDADRTTPIRFGLDRPLTVGLRRSEATEPAVGLTTKRRVVPAPVLGPGRQRRIELIRHYARVSDRGDSGRDPTSEAQAFPLQEGTEAARMFLLVERAEGASSSDVQMFLVDDNEGLRWDLAADDEDSVAKTDGGDEASADVEVAVAAAVADAGDSRVLGAIDVERNVARLLTIEPDRGFRYTFGPASKKRPIRFAVGEPGRRSTVWRLWANPGKNDVYLATRKSAGIFKLSLHESGDWRLQWVTEERGDVMFESLKEDSPEGRVLHQWTRPSANDSGWTDALSIWVPAEDVSGIPGDDEPGHDAQWVAPPPAGAAVEWRVVFVKPDQGAHDLTPALRGPETGLALVNGFSLVGGEVVLLFAATDFLDPSFESHLSQARADGRARARVPNFNLSASSGPRTLVITVDDDGHRNFWDLSLAED